MIVLTPGRYRQAARDRLERSGTTAGTADGRSAKRVLSFREFIERANPRYQFYPHVETKIGVLQRVADGEIRRAMFFEPPRHGKSELTSRLFPAYYLYRFPARFVGLSSYGADLAYGFSRNARAYFQEAGGTIADDAAAVKFWATRYGGGMWAVGVGGPATGRGYHLGVTDDPLKDAEQALSERIRSKHKDWWDSTWSTREEPGGAQVVTLTRWHDDDLAGWLLRREQEALEHGEDEPERWHIVCFEGIRTLDGFRFPASCFVEPDPRAPGEPLCEERVSLRKMLRMKERSPYWFGALYQQRPTPLEGGMWKREWFGPNQVFDVPPPNLQAIGFDWDTAYTENERNSATAYVLTGRDRERNVYVLDAGFQWMETPAAEAWMRSLAERTGYAHYVEAKASGKSIVAILKTRGITAVEVPVTGGLDKVARASLVTPHAEAGKIYVARHVLAMLLDDDRQGILRFPNASHNDLNDVLVQALNRHFGRKGFSFGAG